MPAHMAATGREPRSTAFDAFLLVVTSFNNRIIKRLKVFEFNARFDLLADFAKYRR